MSKRVWIGCLAAVTMIGACAQGQTPAAPKPAAYLRQPTGSRLHCRASSAGGRRRTRSSSPGGARGRHASGPRLSRRRPRGSSSKIRTPTTIPRSLRPPGRWLCHISLRLQRLPWRRWRRRHVPAANQRHLGVRRRRRHALPSRNAGFRHACRRRVTRGSAWNTSSARCPRWVQSWPRRMTYGRSR